MRVVISWTTLIIDYFYERNFVMATLLELKKRVSEVQDAVNVNLNALSDQIQEQIDGLIGSPATPIGSPTTSSKATRKKRKKNKKRNTAASSMKPHPLKGIKQGKRVKNDLTLKQGILRCLEELNIAPTGAIAKNMLVCGWKTKSKKFSGVVGQTLISSDLFERNKEGNWEIA